LSKLIWSLAQNTSSSIQFIQAKKRELLSTRLQLTRTTIWGPPYGV